MALTDWKADSGLVQLAPARGLWRDPVVLDCPLRWVLALPCQAGGTRLVRLFRRGAAPRGTEAAPHQCSGEGALGRVLGVHKGKRWRCLWHVLKGAPAGSMISRATFLPTELSINVLNMQLPHTLSEPTQLLEKWLLKSFEALYDSLRKAGIHPDQRGREVGGGTIFDRVFLVKCSLPSLLITLESSECDTKSIKCNMSFRTTQRLNSLNANVLVVLLTKSNENLKKQGLKGIICLLAIPKANFAS